MAVVELIGGPCDGKKMAVPDEVLRVIVPCLPEDVKLSVSGETEIELVKLPFSGQPVPKPIPLRMLTYLKSADGRFEFAGESV
jgi:hypothetical protein